jgi:hypothetical protein
MASAIFRQFDDAPGPDEGVYRYLFFSVFLRFNMTPLQKGTF